MANITEVNTNDKVLILAPRQGFRRRTTIGTSWTDVRIGMFFTIVPSGNDDAASVTETVTRLGFIDDMTFGLTDHSSIAPYQTGSRYVGWRQHQNATIDISNSVGAGRAWGSGSLMLGAGSNGTVELSGAGTSFGPRFPQYSVTNVNGLWALKFIVSNLGLSSQSIRIHQNSLTTSAFSDVSSANLRTQLLGASYTDTNVDVPFNSGGFALTLPDCFWVRLPFYNHRLRITAYGITKVS